MVLDIVSDPKLKTDESYLEPESQVGYDEEVPQAL